MNRQEKLLAARGGFDVITYKFGDVLPGSVLDFEFNHTNESDMFIESCTPGCGCTDPDVVRKDKISGTFTIPQAKDILIGITEALYKKGITVYFKDDQPIHFVENKIYKTNPNKIKTVIYLEANVKATLS